jgi:four helix bundle protein
MGAAAKVGNRLTYETSEDLSMTGGYGELLVWRKSLDLVDDVYVGTEMYPKSELFGLVSQMRRAAVSIASNIAEGSARHSRRDFIRFLRQSRGSLAELETQIIVSRRRGYIPAQCSERLLRQAGEIGRMLSGLIDSLNAKSVVESNN